MIDSEPTADARSYLGYITPADVRPRWTYKLKKEGGIESGMRLTGRKKVTVNVRNCGN